MRLNREVGDAWMVAIGHNNLANANLGLGDHPAARAHFAASLRAYRGYDDRWAMAFLLEDIAVLAARMGSGTVAFELLGAAATLRDEIGSPRGAALDEEARRAPGGRSRRNRRTRGRRGDGSRSPPQPRWGHGAGPLDLRLTREIPATNRTNVGGRTPPNVRFLLAPQATAGYLRGAARRTGRRCSERAYSRDMRSWIPVVCLPLA